MPTLSDPNAGNITLSVIYPHQVKDLHRRSQPRYVVTQTGEPIQVYHIYLYSPGKPESARDELWTQFDIFWLLTELTNGLAEFLGPKAQRYLRTSRASEVPWPKGLIIPAFRWFICGFLASIPFPWKETRSEKSPHIWCQSSIHGRRRCRCCWDKSLILDFLQFPSHIPRSAPDLLHLRKVQEGVEE